jgi:hypothetical protein
MRYLAPLLLALLLPATALAGGWAIVTLDSTPGEVRPGEPWNVEVKVLQHGRTPLSGVHPAVIVTGPKGERRFAARATGEPGVYAAEVVFPEAGEYAYRVDDGFTNAMPHEFGTVRIGGPVFVAPAAPASAGGDGGGVPVWPFLVLSALAAGVLALRSASWNAARRSARGAAHGPTG